MSRALAVTSWVILALIVLVLVGAYVIPHMALGLMVIAFNVVIG